ncbi:MAG: DNA/RNA non-specific endonuclease [Clostridium sp.]
MKIREVQQRAENLIEKGNEAKEKQLYYQKEVNIARRELIYAQDFAEQAEETDEDGNPVGDVEYARSRVQSAELKLRFLEGNLHSANQVVEKINSDKRESLEYLEKYIAKEKKNTNILEELQSKKFGNNANAFIADLAARMNSSEATRVKLLKSMGISVNAENFPSTGSGADSSEGYGKVNEKGQEKDDAHFESEYKLKPNIKYTVNGYNYKTDDHGRIIQAQGKLTLAKGDRNSQHQLHAGGEDRHKGEDHGGHLIAAQFNGSPLIDNIVAMNGHINKSEYRKLEKTWESALKSNQEVVVDIKPKYSGDSQRPDRFVINYTIDGKKFKKILFNG